jgi:monooxygenase
MTMEHVDVLIVGAGLSGIGAAWHLQTLCPQRSYAIVEARDAIGGTWDLFRYPGVRSDSDMFTLGYRFKPWEHPKAIADGPSIRQYVRDTATENGIDAKIRFRHTVAAATWSSQQARWTVKITRGDAGEPVQISCSFLYMCAGYYRYDKGYTPDFPGMAEFAGRIVHPQQWTDDIDITGKRIVIIGSGATAVTLLPELARKARHVTMLQRSPTYMIARPSEDAFINWMRRHLPVKLAYALARWQRVLLVMLIFHQSRRNPARIKRLLIGGVRKALGRDYDVSTHFTPSYNPWEQRLCLVPDGDMFQAIRNGSASVVTDQIDHFTPTGIRLRSGQQLDADLVVTATGLNLQMFGGMRLTVDGRRIDPAHTLTYKGLMFSGVPNFASCFGYTNASWTLKADLSSQYVCRLLNQLQRTGFAYCVPRNNDPSVTAQPWVDFSSGYFQRAAHLLPKQGAQLPWKLHQNYLRDILLLRHGKLDDGVLAFAHAG